MQPQSGKNLIDRLSQWLRGMWDESARRRASSEPDVASKAQSSTVSSETESDRHGSAVGPADDDVAANDAPARDTGGGSGASEDEFASGGYTPDNPDPGAVKEAAGTQPDTERPSSIPEHPESPSRPESLVDQQMDSPSPQSPNYGAGNLGIGSRGSLGTAPAPDGGPGIDPGPESSVTDFDPASLADAAIADDTESRQPGVVEYGETDDVAPGLGGTTGDEAFSTIDEQNVRGIGDLGADELGSLEELDEDALAFEGDASEQFDANSEPGFAADVPETLGEIDRETDDYSSSALQDAGLRIVDEDVAGLTVREPADDEFVDPGSVIDEPARDTGDARPLGDFAQGRSGIASESDEPTGAAGDRSPEPFGSETGTTTAETWTEGTTTEDLGAAGELAAMDFGSTVGDEDMELEATGLFGASDIDVTDLSYLDESENARYDFSDRPEQVTATMGDVPDSAGPADDIASSPTGVSDIAGAVVSEETVSTEAGAGSRSDNGDIPDSSSSVVDDIADSPTGVVDAEATVNVLEDDTTTPGATREHVPLAATPGTDETGTAGQATAARSGPGGSVRGDESGSCPAEFPIKGNSSSKVYHVPGIPSHDGTKAEWCFATEEQAQAAGYRPPGQRNRGGSSRSSGPNPGREGRVKGSSTR
ncbi:MAG: hypothetical protein WKF63_03270 [Thermomicrobiales bacterium]